MRLHCFHMPVTRSDSSAERLALAGRRRDLNSVQHAVARDRVIKGRADMCA